MYPVEPRTFGTLISDSLSILKRNSWSISKAILIFWIMPVLPVLLTIMPLVQRWPRGLALESMNETNIPPGIAGLLVVLFLTVIVFCLFAAIGYVLLVSIAISDREDETLGLRDHLGPILKRNLWWALAIFVCTLVGTELASSPVADDTAFGGLLYLFVSTILSSILGMKLFMTIPALVLEDRGPLRAIERSWQLTNGFFWKTLGRYFAVTIIGGALVMVPFMVGLVVMSIVVKNSGANNILEGMQDFGTMLMIFLGYLPALIMIMLVLVIEPIYRSEIYYDLRQRKGEFDVETA